MESWYLFVDIGLSLFTLTLSSLFAFLIAKRFGDRAGAQAAIEYAEKQLEREGLAFRALLRDETDENLLQLGGLWNRIDVARLPDTASGVEYGDRALEFISLPMPKWSTEVWGSQNPHVLEFLEGKSREVRTLYTRLRRVTAIHFKLQGLWDEQRTKPGNHSIHAFPVAVYSPFYENAPSLWRELGSLVKVVLKGGNPLGTTSG